MTRVVLALQIWDLTRSSLAVGAIGVVQLVPLLVAGLYGGALADKLDRRRLMLVVGGLQAATSVALAAQAFAGLRQLWLLYLLAAVQSGLVAIYRPARSTFIPALVPAELLSAALTLDVGAGNLTLVVGPALAGVIAGTLGVQVCYLIDAITFVAALYGTAGLPAAGPAAGGARGQPAPSAVADGLGYIRRSQVLAGAFLSDLNATVFGLPTALFPAINAERFHGQGWTYGLLWAAIGVGGLVSLTFSGPLGRVRRHGLGMLCSVAVYGAAFVGFAVFRSLWLTLFALALAGVADAFTLVFRGAIVATITPPEFRGRVMAADFVVGSGGGQLGSLESGGLAQLTSPVTSALAGGLVTVAGSVLIGLALPAFRKYRTGPTGADPAPADADPGPTGADPVPVGATDVSLPGRFPAASAGSLYHPSTAAIALLADAEVDFLTGDQRARLGHCSSVRIQPYGSGADPAWMAVSRRRNRLVTGPAA
ncbi:MAG: hypothetical protein JWM19_5413 [Actinomycetia bacterium]|nr:hypothetical protein [Actinomycetes bacterium]